MVNGVPREVPRPKWIFGRGQADINLSLTQDTVFLTFQPQVPYLSILQQNKAYLVFNKPGVAGAVLYTASSLID